MSLIQAQLARVEELIRSIEQTLTLMEAHKNEGFYSEAFFQANQQQLGQLQATAAGLRSQVSSS